MQFLKGYRTTVFNVIMLITGLCSLVTNLDAAAPLSPTTHAYIAMGITFVTGIGNLVLRIFFTDTPFGVKAAP